MKRFLLLSTLAFSLSACSLTAPYELTFTTPNGALVDPAVDSIALVVEPAALVYLQGVQCGEESVSWLPVPNTSMPEKVHYVSLEALQAYVPGTECTLTITAYDNTTTSTSSSDLQVQIAGEVPAETEAPEVVEEELVEELPLDETPEAGDDQSNEESTETTEPSPEDPEPEIEPSFEEGQ